MPDVALHVPDLAAVITLEPEAIELLRGPSELHDEVAGQVLRLGLAPFLLPEADQGGFIAAHDNLGVGRTVHPSTLRRSIFVHGQWDPDLKRLIESRRHARRIWARR
jgi:hypothetical protein